MTNGTAKRLPETSAQPALSNLLAGYSIEVTARAADAAVAEGLKPGTEVFVANLPNDGLDVLVGAARTLREAGMMPVPHIVARKLRDGRELDDLLARLVGEAGIDRALALGGDRDQPLGELDSSLQLVETGAFEKHGIRHLSFACYPEGHPRIAREVLAEALKDKLAATAARGIEARLVSQFAFDSEPILGMARDLRAAGVTTPLRVGVAGPARRTTLIKYAMRCGIGASLRALSEHKSLVGSLLGGETPEALLSDIAAASEAEPSLGIEGVHFFTFGAPDRSVEWANGRLE